MISAGLLRFEAQRLERSSGRDALGRPFENWTPRSTFRVGLRDLGAAEISYAEGVAVERRFEVVARWQSVVEASVTESDRLSCEGRTLRILSITDTANMQRRAVIQCVEVNL